MKSLIEIAFFTPNVQAMADFYRKFLGAEPVAQSPDMAIFMLENVKLFVHKTYEPAAGDLPPENHFAFGVNDVDAAANALKDAGIVVETPPQDYYWGRSAYLRDPDGHLIELNRPSEGAD